MLIERNTVPVHDTFGNYMVRGIDEILMPAEPGVFPLAPGWYVVLGAMLLLLLYRLIRIAVRWHRNRYRRDAVALLETLSSDRASDAARLVKHVALHGFDRESVASLTGDEWLDFMDQTWEGPSMKDETGKLLVTAAYAAPGSLTGDEFEALKERLRSWIMTHAVGEAVS